MSEEITQIKEEIAEIKATIAQIQRHKAAPNKHCLTVEDVAQWADASEKTVKKWEQEGLLRAQYPNAKKRYLYADVVKFLEGKK